MTEPQESETSQTRTRPTVPRSWFVAAVAVAALIATFLAGMAYQEHRITSQWTTLVDEIDASGPTDGESDEPAAPPVELKTGKPLDVTMGRDSMTITLLSTKLHDEAASNHSLTRHLAYTLKLENSGEKTLTYPIVEGRFESDEGRVMATLSIACDEDPFLGAELAPGQFVQGCQRVDLPDDGGKLVFDEVTPGFFITVPAD